MVLLTDEDVFERYRRRYGQESHGAIRIGDALNLLEFLENLPPSITHVAFDPTESATGRAYCPRSITSGRRRRGGSPGPLDVLGGRPVKSAARAPERRPRGERQVGNKQLEWLKGAAPQQKAFVRMVVGWQRAVVGLNATVELFNAEFFRRSDNPMKLISAKLMVVAALQEIRDLLNKWQGELRKLNAANPDTDRLRGEKRAVLERIDQFRDVRNLVYHFADPIASEIADPDELAALYEAIDAHDLSDLNEMLRALIDIGERMKLDAMTAIDKAK